MVKNEPKKTLSKTWVPKLTSETLTGNLGETTTTTTTTGIDEEKGKANRLDIGIYGRSGNSLGSGGKMAVT